MIYGSVCSGIEAATAAWHPLGWTASFFSEIEPFPRAVLTHHYPKVPLHGDFTTIQAGQYQPIDLLVGGTPCQSFSIAGLRGGLDDDRGNLALEYLRLADRLRPRWLVWENVPGVLSSNGGRDFGAILGGMVELGYGVSYRVLDAQFFGLAQRRRRVFVVGYSGDWRRAAAVLFERESLSGHPAPRRKAGPPVAALTANGVGTCGADDNQAQAGHLISQAFGGGNRSGPLDVTATLTATLTARGHKCDFEVETFIAEQVCFGDVARTLSHRYDGSPCDDRRPDIVAQSHAVRRLTPTECERLQGFPYGFTDIPWRGKPTAPDGPRYKALGNSMAVPCMAWIGRRIQMAEEMA
jgi:DNA (cytosine-5)-methyltransferase 1